MTEVMKTEYQLIDENGCVEDWFDNLDEAIRSVTDEIVRIEKVVTYYSERTIAWTNDEGIQSKT